MYSGHIRRIRTNPTIRVCVIYIAKAWSFDLERTSFSGERVLHLCDTSANARNEKIRQMVTEGHDRRFVGDAFGLSRQRIDQIVVQADKPAAKRSGRRSEATIEKREICAEMLAEGCGYGSIAQQLGVGVPTISGWLKEERPELCGKKPKALAEAAD
jgi:DNA-binding NarL/FixJ family response regulator